MNDNDRQVREVFEKWLHQMMRLSMHEFIRYAKETGLSMTQIGALLQIHRGRLCGVGDVGDELGISNAAASQMIERLVLQGLIERVEDPTDRRSKRLSLTDKGLAVVHDSMYARQRWIPSLISTLSEEEKHSVLKSMDILTEKAGAINVPNRI